MSEGLCQESNVFKFESNVILQISHLLKDEDKTKLAGLEEVRKNNQGKTFYSLILRKGDKEQFLGRLLNFNQFILSL